MNYETHTASMFLDGNYTSETTYREVLELAEQHAPDDAYGFSKVLREYVEREVLDDEPRSSLATDWLGACLGGVDWQTLAENKLGEVEPGEGECELGE